MSVDTNQTAYEQAYAEWVRFGQPESLERMLGFVSHCTAPAGTNLPFTCGDERLKAES